MLRLARAIDWLNEHVGRLAALLLLPSIAITLYEVVMRYVFSAPTIWVNESVLMIFGFYFLLGGGYTLLHGGHVRVDILLQGMQPATRRRLNVFGMLVALFYLGVLLYISGGQAIDSIRYLERAESSWAPYIFPVVSAAPLAAFLLMLQAVSRIIHELSENPAVDQPPLRD